MNAFSYALYRAARLLMTESESIQAAQLAREADAGDTAPSVRLARWPLTESDGTPSRLQARTGA